MLLWQRSKGIFVTLVTTFHYFLRPFSTSRSNITFLRTLASLPIACSASLASKIPLCYDRLKGILRQCNHKEKEDLLEMILGTQVFQWY